MAFFFSFDCLSRNKLEFGVRLVKLMVGRLPKGAMVLESCWVLSTLVVSSLIVSVPVKVMNP